MKKYTVVRHMTEYLDVEADSEEEAVEIANSTEPGWWITEIEDEQVYSDAQP